MPVHVVTIAAANYLPRVMVLAESFRRVHPDGIFDLCIVDDLDGSMSIDEFGIGIIRLTDLPLDPHLLHLMGVYYDVTEFSTALKPWVLQAALERTGAPVLYLDPDIEIFGSLEPLVELAAANEIVLVPHVVDPIPRDGLTPPEMLIMRAGIYNLGFIGVSPAATGFLSFWQERLVYDCVSRPDEGLFTDQKWIDFVPGMFPCVIERDLGYDVAYWNLQERPIALEGDAYTAGGRPLRFLHYSGFDPTTPHILSKHAGDRPRVLLSQHPVLERLCARYAQSLLSWEQRLDAPRYAWAKLPNGVTIDAAVRSIVRECVIAHVLDGEPLPPDPFGIDGAEPFCDWLFSVDGGRGFTRYQEGVLTLRRDVEIAHPEIFRGVGSGFLRWLRANAVRESHLSPELVDRLDREVSAWIPQQAERPVPGAPPVVDVIGLFRAEMGVGEAARRSALALRAAGVNHRTVGWHQASISRLAADAPDSSVEATGIADIAVAHVNADVFDWLTRDLGGTLLDGRHRIGVWFWELSVFPRDLWPAFNLVDEVWVATRFMQESISTGSPVPVVHMPVPLVAPPIDRSVTREQLGLDDRFTFLFVFDMLSVRGRKNPVGLIEAYTKAFAPGDGARLVIKTINADRRVLDHERVLLAAAGRDDVDVRDGYLDSGHLGALIDQSDCYVSLHRSEGLGLTIAEAMTLGKPVIATAYSGNVDFMTPETSHMIGCRLVPVGPGNDPYPPEALWAEPDLEQAAAAMRAVFDDPAAAREMGERARLDLAMRFSPAVCGRRMAERFERIRAGRGRRWWS